MKKPESRAYPTHCLLLPQDEVFYEKIEKLESRPSINFTIPISVTLEYTLIDNRS
jgi:hypothetical protein